MKITNKNYLRLSGKNHEIIQNDTTQKTAYHYDTVLTVTVYEKDFHSSSYSKNPLKEKDKYAKRGTIQKATARSLKRLTFLLRNSAHKMEYEIGLTYPKEYSNDGLLVKKHLHTLRSRLNYYGYKYVWVLEFQKRGAPHFHMLLNKEITRETLAFMWFDIVKSGDRKHLKRGVHVAKIRGKNAMALYFCSYLTKQDQKHVPKAFMNVGRFWGASRNLIECTIKKYYGTYRDIQELKRELRPLRRWYDNQKKQWSKKKKYKRVSKNIPSYRGTSLKIVDRSLFVSELQKRGLLIDLYEK